MKHRLIGATAALALVCATAGTAHALDIAWVHSNAAAQSEQRVKAGFDAWLSETDKSDWSVNLLDSGGSGERTASNIQDAASRGADAIVITMADLRASRAALDAAVAARSTIFDVESGLVVRGLVDESTYNWAMSASV
jgi:ribose transport system substrate-binding protein